MRLLSLLWRKIRGKEPKMGAGVWADYTKEGDE